jgi:hypothetical protein
MMIKFLLALLIYDVSKNTYLFMARHTTKFVKFLREDKKETKQ